MKKRTVLLIILFIAILVCSYFFYQKYNSKTNINPNITYTYEIKDNQVLLKNEKEIVSTYKCMKDCTIYQDYYANGKILLKDNNVIYLFDLINGKKLTDTFKDVAFVYDNNKVKYFVVTDYFNKQGVIDLNGKITIKITYDQIGKRENNIVSGYSCEHDFIAAENDKTWGLLGLSNGKGVIDFQYQDLVVTDYQKLAVKEKDLWYIVDFTNKKVLPTGYEQLLIMKDYAVVYLNKELYVLDYAGNVISSKITVNDETVSLSNTEIKVGSIIYHYDEVIKDLVK